MNQSPDLLLLLINLGKFMPSLITFTQVIIGIVGFFMVGAGLLYCYIAANPDAAQSFGSQGKPTTGGGLGMIFIGVIMSGISSLKVIAAFSNEILGNTQAKITSEALDIGGHSDKFGSAEAQAAVIGLLLIMQCLGLVAIFKSCLICISRAKNSGGAEDTYSKAAFFFVFGLLAWNFQLTTQIINNTIGFDVIALFTPFAG